MFKDFEKKKFKGDRVEQIREYMASQLAIAHAKKDNWDKFSHYTSMVNNKRSWLIPTTAWPGVCLDRV